MTALIVLGWIVLGLIALAVVGHVLAWLLYVPVAVRVFGETPWLPAQWQEPLGEGEHVNFYTQDGARLEGTYLRTTAAARKGVVAFCHQLNGDRWATVPYTEDLRRQGFDIFTFDFRNHGGSDRVADWEPMPWVTVQDLTDVQAAIDYVCGRSDADPRGIGLIGVSKGATVALCAAASDTRVRTLVLDGPCPTERMQLHYVRRFMQIYVAYPWLVSRLPDLSLRSTNAWTKFVVQRQRHCRFVNVDQAARQVRQPVMMIHGQRDAHVPVEVARGLRNSMPNCTRLWVVPNAKHNGGIMVARNTYHRRIARFFERHLAVPTVAEQSPQPLPSPRLLAPKFAGAAGGQSAVTS
ncbi:MAG: alpha/beta fold hydrolase [Pirellulales bacterium]|nr:alpha/beta fold hydrolase [Pirellulales bacterium]